MEQFRTDNTDGYTEEQLKELNRRYDEATADINADEEPDDYLDYITEKILRDYDSEIYNR